MGEAVIISSLYEYLSTRQLKCLQRVSITLDKMLMDAPKDLKHDCSYYNAGGRQVIDIISDVLQDGYDYYLVGNIIKYIKRYKKKHKDIYNQYVDLLKAKNYTKFLLKNFEKSIDKA